MLLHQLQSEEQDVGATVYHVDDHSVLMCTARRSQLLNASHHLDSVLRMNVWPAALEEKYTALTNQGEPLNALFAGQ